MKLFIDYPPRIDQCVRGRLWKKFHWLPPTHWTMYESSWNFLEFYNISQYFTVFVKGSNLLNNNVNTVSLARTHRVMQTSSFEIRVQYGPPACGRRSILDPNFSGFRSAFADASSPDSRHCPNQVLNNAKNFYKKTYSKTSKMTNFGTGHLQKLSFSSYY